MTILLATTLLSAVSQYVRTIGAAGIEQAVAGASPRDAGVQVSVPLRTAAADLAAVDAVVRAALADARVPSSAVTDSLLSGSFTVRGPTAETAPLAVVASYADLPRHADLVAGRWPSAGTETVLPAAAAAGLGVVVGDRVTLTRPDRPVDAVLTVVGLFRPRDTSEGYWFDDELETTGSLAGDFTTFGPLVVDRSRLLSDFAVAGSAARWRAAADPAAVSADDLGPVAAAVDGLRDTLAAARTGSRAADAALDAATVTTGLPRLLLDLQRALLVSTSTALLPVLQLGLLALGGLALLARLLTDHRALEAALVRARGASARQLAGWNAREGLLVVLPAVLVGAPLGAWLTHLLSRTTTFERAGLALPSRPDALGWLVAALVGALSLLVLVVPALTRERTYVDARQSRGRELAGAVARRGGVDLALLALAVLAYTQLRRYEGPVTVAAGGRLGVDPLLVAGPTIMLVAGALLVLRLVPWLGSAADRTAARGRQLPRAVAAWQLARRPTRASGPVLLLVLAVSIGVLTATYTATLAASQRDQVAFALGADLRVTPPGALTPSERLALQPRYAGLPGVTTALPAHRGRGVVAGQPVPLLGLDARTAAEVVPVRADLSRGGTPQQALARLAEDRPDPVVVPLPADATAVDVSVRVAAPAPVEVSVVVRDSLGQVVRLPAGTVAPDGRTAVLTADLPPGAGRLDLLGIEAELATSPFGLPETTTLVLVGVSTRAGPADPAPLPPADWRAVIPADTTGRASAELTTRPTAADALLAAVVTARPTTAATSIRLLLTPGDLVGVLPAAVPVLLDGSLTDGLPPGSDVVEGDLAGPQVDLAPVSTLEEIPTFAGEPGLVVDLPTLALVRFVRAGASTTGTEWWLDTQPAAAGQPRQALADGAAPAPEVVDQDTLLAEKTRAPLAVGVVGLLTVALAAAAGFAVVGFTASAAVAGRERTTELGLLRALGLSTRQLTRVLLGEQLALVLLGVLAGLGLGLVVARLVVPLVVLTPQAGRPLPEPLLAVPWPAVVGLCAAVVATLAGVALVVAARVRRASAAATLRLGADR
ncbi:MAG: FtsX-like permease family protein [Actinomycetia bacterium]|nr:FtsX-like permease family protein [Actinomycetes bacterium]